LVLVVLLFALTSALLFASTGKGSAFHKLGAAIERTLLITNFPDPDYEGS